MLERGVESGEFRSDLDVDVITAAFAAWFDGAMFHWLVLPDGTRLNQMADLYIDVFLRGSLRRDGGSCTAENGFPLTKVP